MKYGNIDLVEFKFGSADLQYGIYNGEIIWGNPKVVTLPQFHDTTDLTVYLKTTYPSDFLFEVVNVLNQPTLQSGSLEGIEALHIINNNTINGTNPGDNGLELTALTKVTDNGIIRGAGGNGGLGGRGGRGGNGGTGKDIATISGKFHPGRWAPWYTDKEGIAQTYFEFTNNETSDNEFRVVVEGELEARWDQWSGCSECIDSIGDIVYLRGENPETGNATRSYKADQWCRNCTSHGEAKLPLERRDYIEAYTEPAILGSDGGKGGYGGTGGPGCTSVGTGACFKRGATAGGPGGKGLQGKPGNPSNPAGGNAGGKGGVGGTGGKCGNGGNWGAQGYKGNSGGVGSTGLRGEGGGNSGTAGNPGAAGEEGQLPGLGITGYEFLDTDSVIGLGTTTD